MYTAESYSEVQLVSNQTRAKNSYRVTYRDLEILGFVLAMKFSTIEDIHAKFFRFTRDGGQSTCLRWARERVAHLVRSEFLKPVKHVCQRTLYILTSRGYLYLKNSCPDRRYSRPLNSVDGRTYDHDQKVIRLRSVFEDSGLSLSWISERELAEFEEYRTVFSAEFRPDAIYVDASGEKVAFELEIALKSKARYQAKIRKYVEWLREYRHTQSTFKRVHFLIVNKSVKKHLDNFTAMYGDLFIVEMVSSYLDESGGVK